MGDLHGVANAFGECMVTHLLILEHAELLVGEPVAGNRVAIEDAGVSGQARKNR
jgi:hypothetical protein